MRVKFMISRRRTNVNQHPHLRRRMRETSTLGEEDKPRRRWRTKRTREEDDPLILLLKAERPPRK